MNDATKTLAFVGAAVVVIGIAVVTRPRPPVADASTFTRDEFNSVDDPLAARRLEIVKYDEEKATIGSFEVAHVDGRWSIPSHSNYPADAEQQMSEAATSVMNLKVLGMASTERGDHATYGVVEPDPEKLQAGTTGVGMKVTMNDGQGEALVDMIVGIKVKDQEGQRYVRQVGKDPVYIVALDPAKLSTDFSDWIEKDLLKLNAWDVSGLQLNDYSIELTLGADGRPTVLMDPRGEMTLAYNDGGTPAWKLTSLKEFDPKKDAYAAVTLPEDQQLNEVKLNDLKSALDDLKIVEVEAKPEGLSADLKAQEDFARNVEAVQSLAARGFYPVPTRDRKSIEILSSEGEAICQMQDGVEYVLRFGKIILGGASSQTEEGEEPDSGINRYLFVTARFNEDLLEKPDIKALPAKEEGAESNEKQESAEKGAEAKEADEKGAEAKGPDASAKEAAGGPQEGAAAKKDPAPAAEEGAPGPEGEPGEAAADGADAGAPADRVAEPADRAAEPAESADKPADAPAGDAKEDAASPPADAGVEKGAADAEAEALEAARAALEKENEKKQKEYDEKVKQGRERVDDLNKRFGDWYYVISDDVYKKIHLGKQDVLKEKKPAQDAAGPGGENGITPSALDRLEQQGLKAE